MGAMNETPKFLVYGLIDPRTNELRYVGKSSVGMRRPRFHSMPSGRMKPTHTGAWLRQMWCEGKTIPSVLVLLSCASEAEALSKEIEIIALFRELGFSLTNHTDGGEGSSGYKPSEATRNKQSEARKGCKCSEETKQKLSAILTGKKRSDEARRNISIAHKGIKPSVEARANLSKALKGRKHSAATREKMSKSRMGYVMPETTREKLRVIGTGKHLSAEARAKVGAASASRVRPPEEYDSRRGPRKPEIGAKISATKQRKKQERQNALLTVTQEACIVPAVQETRKESEYERIEKQAY